MPDEIKYRIITAEKTSTLAAAVNGVIREGWACTGGVAVTRDDFGAPRLMQAMVKP